MFQSCIQEVIECFSWQKSLWLNYFDPEGILNWIIQIVNHSRMYGHLTRINNPMELFMAAELPDDPSTRKLKSTASLNSSNPSSTSQILQIKWKEWIFFGEEVEETRTVRITLPMIQFSSIEWIFRVLLMNRFCIVQNELNMVKNDPKSTDTAEIFGWIGSSVQGLGQPHRCYFDRKRKPCWIDKCVVQYNLWPKFRA